MQEALGIPIAIVLGLFMASYLPWESPCDPAEGACITSAQWAALVRFVGGWDERAVVRALGDAGFDVQAGWGSGVQAEDGGSSVRLYSHDDVPVGQQTVVYLVMEMDVPLDGPTKEGSARAGIKAALPAADGRLGALRDSLVSSLGWRAYEGDEAIWSVTMERIGGTGLVEIEATNGVGP